MSIQLFNELDNSLPCWGGWIFIQSTDSTTNMSQNPLIDTPRKDALPATWASLSTGKVANEIDHHKKVGLLSKCAFLVGLGQADGSARWPPGQQPGEASEGKFKSKSRDFWWLN